MTEAFRLIDPVWIEHHPPASTDGRTETYELVAFPPFGKPVWKTLEYGTGKVRPDNPSR